MNSLWKFFTSLRLTVVCLCLSILIVFFGTLAQVHEGLWVAQERWFRSFIIWWSPEGGGYRLPMFPGGYLVGSLLMANLIAAHIKRFKWGWRHFGIEMIHGGLILLLLGGLFTDQFARESLMSLQEGQSQVYSESAREDELVFATDADGTREEVISLPGKAVARQGELKHEKLPFVVKVTKYGPNGDIVLRSSVGRASQTLLTAIGTMEAEYASPESLPEQAKRALEAEGRVKVWKAALQSIGEDGKGDLVAIAQRLVGEPEKAAKLLVELKKRFKEAMLGRFQVMPRKRAPTDEEVAQARLSERLMVGQPILPEVFPVLADNPAAKESVVFELPASAEMDKRNIAWAVVDLQEQGKSLGTWLVSPTLKPVEVKAGGKTFRMSFRFERYYQPFSVTLLKATHDVYPGTVTVAEPQGIPKNFQSRVRIDHPEKKERREVDIYMNNPLRYGGLTFFQYQMGEAAGSKHIGTSTFQVVKNPSWLTPYFGCAVISFGLLFQFGYHLLKFLNKRKAVPHALASAPAKPLRESRTPAGAGAR